MLLNYILNEILILSQLRSKVKSFDLFVNIRDFRSQVQLIMFSCDSNAPLLGLSCSPIIRRETFSLVLGCQRLVVQWPRFLLEVPKLVSPDLLEVMYLLIDEAFQLQLAEFRCSVPSQVCNAKLHGQFLL